MIGLAGELGQDIIIIFVKRDPEHKETAGSVHSEEVLEPCAALEQDRVWGEEGIVEDKQAADAEKGADFIAEAGQEVVE